MNKLISLSLLACCFLIATCHVAAVQSRDEPIIAYAKRIKVSSLDPTLPRKSIESWLRSIVGPKTALAWKVNDCGEETGVAGDGSGVNPPICAEVNAKLADGRTLGISIEVGTHKAGVRGKPGIAYIYILDNGREEYPANLRDIPPKIHKVKND